MTDSGYDRGGSVSPVAQPRGRFCTVYLQTEASFNVDFLVLVTDTFTALPRLHRKYLLVLQERPDEHEEQIYLPGVLMARVCVLSEIMFCYGFFFTSSSIH